MKMKNAKKLSDLFKDDFVTLPRIKIDDVINKDIIILNAKFFEGKFGPYMILQIRTEGKDYTLLTGASVLLQKISDAVKANFIPCTGKIIKRNNYYDIV